MKIRYCFVLIGLGLLLACSKPEEPTAVITGHVKHHEWYINGAKVYLKKNVTEFPGKDASLYDVEANTEFPYATYRFGGLAAGNYYLYAEGYDSLIGEPVRGYYPVKINNNLEVVEQDIAVAERSHE